MTSINTQLARNKLILQKCNQIIVISTSFETKIGLRRDKSDQVSNECYDAPNSVRAVVTSFGAAYYI